MSRRARQSTGTTSLFPFLAVLVCAMGALILLLLVTTRRIRQQTLEDGASAGAQEKADTLPSESVPLLPVMATEPQVEVAASPAAEFHDEPILPLLTIDPPQPEAVVPDPAKALRARLAALETEHRALGATLADWQAELADFEAVTDAERAALANIRGESQQLTAEKQHLNNLYRRLLDQQQETEQRAEDLKQDIERARVQLAEADSKFAVVPYDGHSGTTRRPLIIECTEDRLTFASEGVTLNATDMNGFTPRYNPLLYATQALMRYWERRDRTSAGEELGEPYLLLVVRPGGTTAYYAARELLAGIRQPFGYELVTDDQDFTWPPSDPEAAAICRTIVDRMLADRDELVAVALKQGAHLTDYSDGQGRFRLEEIERLKNPTRHVTINGQRFSRDLGPRRYRLGTSREENGTGTARSDQFSPESPLARGATRRAPANFKPSNGSSSGAPETFSSSGVHTQQQTAVTRDDRMPEWLREGTARLDTSREGAASLPDAKLTDRRRESGTSSHWESTRSNLGRGSFSDSATSPGQPTRNRSPASAQPLTKTAVSRSRKPTINPIRPQWGIRSPGGTIGFEREVGVRISATQVNVGEDSAFQLTGGMTTDALRRLLAAAVDREVRTWGVPPRSFYWVPSVRFTVGPGASQTQQRLKGIIEGWGLRSSVEYAAE